MQRRNFIKNTAAASAFVGLGSPMQLLAKPKNKHITILHTNDVHSHVEPFPANDPKYAGKGGVSRRYNLVESIRRENPNTLLFDAGDIFQGTPYFNFYGGEIEFKLMSKLGYDAATVGNHDFDNGVGGLAAQMPNATFKMITSNYDFTNTIMEGQTEVYQVYERDSIRIGVFGLDIQLHGLVDPRMYKETVFLDPVERAQDMARILKEEKNCDLIICLSHLGYEYKSDKISDMALAKKTKDIDLIIGGHTHTFLPRPTVVQNSEGKEMLINQVGWAGINLGRLDFYFDENRKKKASAVTINV